MTDHRKVLESTPEPASLDRTMPAPSKPADEGTNIGGITKTAESGLRNEQAASGETGQPAPNAPSKRFVQSDPAPEKSLSRSTNTNAEAERADSNTPEDESALESLGRAIGAPLSGEAADREPRR